MKIYDKSTYRMTSSYRQFIAKNAEFSKVDFKLAHGVLNK